MKNKITKLLALMMAIAIVLSLAGCGKDKEKETTTAVGEMTTLEDESTLVDETTALAEETTVVGDTIAVGATTVAGQTTTAAAANTIPTTKEEILKAYTDVMNKAKNDKPAFKKYEYQELPDGEKYRNITGGEKIINALLNLVNKNFLKTKEQAKSAPGIYTKNGDMNAFPIRDAAKGCLLTDVSAIKTANCVVQADGKYKLTITLNNETNPAHYRTGNTAPSKTGGIFMPLDNGDVDPALEKGFVKLVVRNTSYTMEYYDCTVALVYDPVTQRVVSVDQTLNNKLTMSGKVIGTDAEGWQVLIMHYNITEVVY